MDPQAFTVRDSLLCRPYGVLRWQPRRSQRGVRMEEISCKGGDVEDALRIMGWGADGSCAASCTNKEGRR